MSHMMSQLSRVITDVSVLRRILFAVVHLPPDCLQFGVGQRQSRNTITPAQAHVLFENLSELNSEAFVNDQSLLTEFSQHQFPHSSLPPLGIVLISPKTVCCKCGGPLFLRADRPSRMVIYDNKLGTLPATHYHKDCRKPQCRVHQYYDTTVLKLKGSHIMMMTACCCHISSLLRKQPSVWHSFGTMMQSYL